MKLESTIKKIEKRLNVKAVAPESECGFWTFTANGMIGRFRRDSSGNTHGFHVQGEDQHSDPLADYYPGAYYDNCTQMLNVIDPPAPKFAEGSLIKGKENKRADRLGIAGRMGIVTRVQSYGCYTLLMSDTGQEERYSYERDLELVSISE